MKELSEKSVAIKLQGTLRPVYILSSKPKPGSVQSGHGTARASSRYLQCQQVILYQF